MKRWGFFLRSGSGFFWSVAVLLLVDRLTKWLALAVWAERPLQLFPGVRLQLLLNQGIAFSLPIGGVLLVTGTMFVLVLVVVFFIRMIRRGDQTQARWLLLLLAGAGSNIADRLLYGGVVDIVEFGFLPVFNLADLMILCSLFAVAILDFRRSRS